jgi:hypothetical protein
MWVLLDEREVSFLGFLYQVGSRREAAAPNRVVVS